MTIDFFDSIYCSCSVAHSVADSPSSEKVLTALRSSTETKALDWMFSMHANVCDPDVRFKTSHRPRIRGGQVRYQRHFMFYPRHEP